jgi:hypothetical protein
LEFFLCAHRVLSFTHGQRMIFLMLGSYAVELFTVFRLQGGFASEMFVDSFSCLTHVHAVSDG